MGERMQNIIGIYFGHNSGVCLLQNGQIKAFYLEERFTRVKNYTGFPTLAYQKMLDDFLDNDPEQIDLIVLPTDSNLEFQFFINDGNAFPGGKYFDYYHKTEKNYVPRLFRISQKLFGIRHLLNDRKYVKNINNNSDITNKMKAYLATKLKVNEDKLIFINHHLAHAYSTCFNLEIKIITSACASSKVKEAYCSEDKR